jgi:hypothetical protein
MRWGYAYFHLLIDCLLAVTTQLATLTKYSARDTVDVYTVPEVLRFWPWFERVLLAQNSRYRPITRPRQKGLRAQYTAWPTDKLIRYACKPCLRDLAYAYEGLKPFYEPVTCTHTLLLVRTGTRKLRNYPSLWVHLARVSAPYDVPVVPFFGNESVSEMIRLFSSACAVVGTHGAGHANTIFSRRDALIVEISTYAAPQSLTDIDTEPVLWRSNEYNVATGLDYGMKWTNYHVEYAYLRPIPQEQHYRPNGTIEALQGYSWNSYIKGMHMALDRQHIHNIAALVGTHLGTVLPRRDLRIQAP